MKDNMKVGDKVRRIEKFRNFNGYPYEDMTLTIKSMNASTLYFEEIDSSWESMYFELAETLFEDKIVKAYKMIGTTVYYKSSIGKLFPFKVHSIKVRVNDIQLFEYSVGGYLDFNEVVERPTSIIVKLNDDHKASVTKDTIKVGCQTFPISIIDDLVKARKDLTID